MADDPKKFDSVHMPVPYVARVRCVVQADLPPEWVTVRTFAYSVAEAHLQVIIAGSAKGTYQQYQVEDIQADVAGWHEYAKMTWDEVLEKVKAAMRG